MHTSRTQPTVTILISALNEEKNIKKIVSDCLKIKQYKVTALVIIDRKTTDHTDIVAKKAGGKIIYAKGVGKGSTIKSALPYLKSTYTVQIDADYQFIPKEIPKLVDKLINGYDLALGTRYQNGAQVEKGSVSPFKYLGSYFLSIITSLFAQQKITDVMAGFKGFKTAVLKDLNPQTSHFGYEAELVVRAAKRKYRIINIPITYKKRMSGRSSVASVKHGLLVLGTIIRTGLE